MSLKTIVISIHSIANRVINQSVSSVRSATDSVTVCDQWNVVTEKSEFIRRIFESEVEIESIESPTEWNNWHYSLFYRSQCSSAATSSARFPWFSHFQRYKIKWFITDTTRSRILRVSQKRVIGKGIAQNPLEFSSNYIPIQEIWIHSQCSWPLYFYQSCHLFFYFRPNSD